MSVPGAVQPARLNGMLLVDGGLTDNLPIGVARSMGAEIVIAVNLGTPLLKPQQLTSVFSVTDQMVNILTEQNVQASLASLKSTDILVLPQLGDFSASDFDHLAATVPIGEAAARAVASQLAALSVPQAQYAAWSAHRTRGTVDQIAPVDSIEFTHLAHVESRHRPFGDRDQARQADRLRRYSTRDMPPSLWLRGVPSMCHYDPGRAPASASFPWTPSRRPGARTTCAPDWGLSSDFKGDAYFNLLASFRMTWLNRLGAEWRTDLQAGRTNRLETEFYQPIESSQTFFAAPYAGYQRRPIDVYKGEQRISRYDLDSAWVGADLGAQFTKYGETRLGIVGNVSRSWLDTGPAFLQATEGQKNYSAFQWRGLVDQLDSVNFPRSGYSASFNIFAARAALGSDATFTRGEASASYVTSFGDNTFSAAFKAGGIRSESNPLPASAMFQWGGLLQQSGFPTGALLGQELEFGRLVYYRRLAQFSLLDGVYGGLSLEAGRMGRPLIPGNNTGTLYSAGLFLGVDTPVGPLYLGYGHANKGYGNFYLFLGRP